MFPYVKSSFAVGMRLGRLDRATLGRNIRQMVGAKAEKTTTERPIAG